MFAQHRAHRVILRRIGREVSIKAVTHPGMRVQAAAVRLFDRHAQRVFAFEIRIKRRDFAVGIRRVSAEPGVDQHDVEVRRLEAIELFQQRFPRPEQIIGSDPHAAGFDRRMGELQARVEFS